MAKPRDIPTWTLIPFLLLTFAITWGLVGVYIVFPEWATARFGEISGRHPFFFLATWAPAIAAILLVVLHGGVAGLRAFLSRVLHWRVALTWVGFVLILLPAVFVAGSLIKGGPMLAPFPPEGAGPLFGVLAMMLFLGPVEEFGWRGLAQPILQRVLAPVWAGAVIGAIWGIWHLPAFYLAGVVFAEWSFLPFFIGNVTLAVLVTPLFNTSRGSLLWPVLFHWQLINPFWPDAQPYDTWILVAVAAWLLWWTRKEMFARHGAITEVIPSGGKTD